eukprot:2629682-Rhodomonas_salina.1
MRLKESIDAAKARAKTGAARLPLLRRIDMVWIESEIGSRIVQARAREEERMKDPITRLESELKHALEDEFFEDAAQVFSGADPRPASGGGAGTRCKKDAPRHEAPACLQDG